jgi:hypothetical protein
MPGVGKRIILLPFFRSEIGTQAAIWTHGIAKCQVVPWEEHEIREAYPVAYEVFVSGLLEMELNDTSDTLDLVCVAVDCGCYVLLRMELEKRVSIVL